MDLENSLYFSNPEAPGASVGAGVSLGNVGLGRESEDDDSASLVFSELDIDGEGGDGVGCGSRSSGGEVALRDKIQAVRSSSSTSGQRPSTGALMPWAPSASGGSSSVSWSRLECTVILVVRTGIEPLLPPGSLRIDHNF